MDGWPVSEGNVSETNHDCKGRSSLCFRYFNFKMKHEVFGLFIGTGTWSQAKGQLVLIQCTCVRLETRTDEGRGRGGTLEALYSPAALKGVGRQLSWYRAHPEVDAQQPRGRSVILTLSRMVRTPRPSLITRKSKANPVLRRENWERKGKT